MNYRPPPPSPPACPPPACQAASPPPACHQRPVTVTTAHRSSNGQTSSQATSLPLPACLPASPACHKAGPPACLPACHHTAWPGCQAFHLLSCQGLPVTALLLLPPSCLPFLCLPHVIAPHTQPMNASSGRHATPLPCQHKATQGLSLFACHWAGLRLNTTTKCLLPPPPLLSLPGHHTTGKEKSRLACCFLPATTLSLLPAMPAVARRSDQLRLVNGCLQGYCHHFSLLLLLLSFVACCSSFSSPPPPHLASSPSRRLFLTIHMLLLGVVRSFAAGCCCQMLKGKREEGDISILCVSTNEFYGNVSPNEMSQRQCTFRK